MSIGERLRLAAKARSQNLKEFSRLVDVPYRTLQGYLSGERNPKSEIVAQICARSSISGTWLLSGEGEMFEGEDDGVAAEAAAAIAKDGLPLPLGLAGQERRVEALLAVLGRLAPEVQDAMLSECLSRATSAEQLSELQRAVQELGIQRRA